jgi:nitrogen fixation protein NifU and related proteins
MTDPSQSPDEAKLQQALADPQNLGELADADAVGTAGSPDCGDMVRLWLKFKEEDGRRVIDKASFQSFGCQTAIAVASLATQMLKGKTAEEARALDASQLAAPLGALPPMKIHCGQMVEGALKAALDAGGNPATPTSPPMSPHPDTAPALADALAPQPAGKKIRVILQPPN